MTVRLQSRGQAIATSREQKNGKRAPTTDVRRCEECPIRAECLESVIPEIEQDDLRGRRGHEPRIQQGISGDTPDPNPIPGKP